MSNTEQSFIQQHILQRYEVLKKIGSGAYGHVWKVQEKSSRKVLALKKIFDAFQHSTDAQRTYREIEILRQLSHPNIIKLHETYKADNNKDVYLLFEFMEADLHNVISEGILKEVHIRFIVYQIAKALKYLHSGCVIHRDLKPSNILINSNCSIKLCDFGLVRSLASKQHSTPVLTEGVATRWYRAPEVLLGSQKYSTPADIWSFGCIIYEILAQKPMFPGENTTDQINKIISYAGYPTEEEVKSLRSEAAKSMLREAKAPHCLPSQKAHLKDLPPMFAELIRQMTVLNPSERITVDQILQSEVVQPFRKKEEEIVCEKIIVTEINDNKKLSVDQYRKLIYGIKRSQSSSEIKNKNISLLAETKKSSSYTRLSTATNEPLIYQPDNQIGRYLKTKQLMKNISYNKTVNELGMNGMGEKKVEETTAESRKEMLKDPTRITYISKNVYSPKYNDVGQKPYVLPNHSFSSHFTPTNSSMGMPGSAMSSSTKFGTSFTASSAYTKDKRPVLFKSSKYGVKPDQPAKE